MHACTHMHTHTHTHAHSHTHQSTHIYYHIYTHIVYFIYWDPQIFHVFSFSHAFTKAVELNEVNLWWIQIHIYMREMDFPFYAPHLTCCDGFIYFSGLQSLIVEYSGLLWLMMGWLFGCLVGCVLHAFTCGSLTLMCKFKLTLPVLKVCGYTTAVGNNWNHIPETESYVVIKTQTECYS